MTIKLHCQFSLLLNTKIVLVARVVNLVYTYLTRGIENSVRASRDRRIRWCHLSAIPGTTPHCLVSTEVNANSSGNRILV